MSRPHYHGHRARLRERLAKNPRQLADYEVLELVLGYVLVRQDTKPLAKELLRRFKSLRGVFQADPRELTKVEGFGPALATYFALHRETWARLHESSVVERVALSGPQEVAALAKARLGNRRSEEFWLAMVDNKNRLMAWEMLSSGTVDQAPVYPREVLARALENQASGIVLVHNHPGGDPRPSNQDLEMTRRLARTGNELGIRVLDHLIVTDGDYFSFQSEGML